MTIRGSFWSPLASLRSTSLSVGFLGFRCSSAPHVAHRHPSPSVTSGSLGVPPGGWVRVGSPQGVGWVEGHGRSRRMRVSDEQTRRGTEGGRE